MKENIEINTDKKSLVAIESVIDKIIRFSKEQNKEALIVEFNKIYDFFVVGKGFEAEEVTISDLKLSTKAIIIKYVEIAMHYVKDYISTEQYNEMYNVINNTDNIIRIGFDIYNKNGTLIIKKGEFVSKETLESNKLSLLDDETEQNNKKSK